MKTEVSSLSAAMENRCDKLNEILITYSDLRKPVLDNIFKRLQNF